MKLFGAGLHERADRRMAEGGIGLADEPLEDRRLDLTAEKRRQHADREIGIG